MRQRGQPVAVVAAALLVVVVIVVAAVTVKEQALKTERMAWKGQQMHRNLVLKDLVQVEVVVGIGSVLELLLSFVEESMRVVKVLERLELH